MLLGTLRGMLLVSKGKLGRAQMLLVVLVLLDPNQQDV